MRRDHDMAKLLRLKYTVEDPDRHGNVRVYFRRPGQPKIRLPGLPGSDEFMEVYRAALAVAQGRAKAAPAAVRAGAAPVAPGTLRWLFAAYYASAEFQRLQASTRYVRRGILDSICREPKAPSEAALFGSLPFKGMPSTAVRVLRDRKASAPEAANGRVKALRQVFAWALEARHVETNPARDVKYLKGDGEGHRSWTLEDVQAFEAAHPIGTTARLALALLLYTGQRKSDVVTMGRQHVRAGRLVFTQAKNKANAPIHMSIPLVPELATIIAATPSHGDGLAFLATSFARPFTVNGFGNRFRKWVLAAGLDGLSAHGLRKATASRLAELGATEHEIMAITGHRTSKEVTRYTRAARQAVTADRSGSLLNGAWKVPTPEGIDEPLTISPANPLKLKEA